MTEVEAVLNGRAPKAARRPMRRGSIYLAATLWLALLGLPGVGAAAPTATFKVKPTPIPGFPHTGNFLGAGAEVEVQVTIAGTEYDGFPSPMTGLDIYAPAGVRLTTKGFATCAPSTLEEAGAAGCPKKSRAGPPGVGLGIVTFGGEQVPEEVAIQEFFAPAGGLSFYVEGDTPASFHVLERAHWLRAAAPFGPELAVEVPLIETVPGGNDASVTSFRVKVGAAYRQGRRMVSYITTPTKCPRHGFPMKLELHFLSGETVTVTDVVPCPGRRGR
jgi:hypothetical protein